MLLRRLALSNYATFASADFDLRTSFEKPIVLFTGNNGAGKTSTLEAFRLALYGKKAFSAISEDEYQDILRGKFHDGNFDCPSSITLEFQYADGGDTHDVTLTRSWRLRRKSVAEDLRLTMDGQALEADLADDLLCAIVPPEILRYFFFDGEKVAELADWESGDDSALFASVNDLLGLNIAGQLERDLTQVMARASRTTGFSLRELSDTLSILETDAVAQRQNLKERKQYLASALRRQEAARRRFAALGGVFAEERARDEAELAEYGAQIEALEDAMRADAAAVLPLLVAPGVFASLETDVSKSEALEILAVLQHALAEARGQLERKLASLIEKKQIPGVLNAVRESMLPKPVALDHEPLDLSLREASWMRNVLSRELPALRQRLIDMCARHEALQKECELRRARLQLAPTNDRAVEEALCALEEASADTARAQDAAQVSERELNETLSKIDDTTDNLRKARHSEFRGRRLALRDELAEKVVTMLPEFAQRVRKSKEARFSSLLLESLTGLWHKRGRLQSVSVDFGVKNVDLFSAKGIIRKRDLSAAEKQLFAIAFIFSLAKLSNRNLPFVIDTPLARLDAAHRVKLLAQFLPTSTHQAILFSTDTEVVGSLFSRTRQFISHHYELADYNGGITQPVQLAIAL